jgi:hypothetical protein
MQLYPWLAGYQTTGLRAARLTTGGTTRGEQFTVVVTLGVMFRQPIRLEVARSVERPSSSTPSPSLPAASCAISVSSRQKGARRRTVAPAASIRDCTFSWEASTIEGLAAACPCTRTESPVSVQQLSQRRPSTGWPAWPARGIFWQRGAWAATIDVSRRTDQPSNRPPK